MISGKFCFLIPARKNSKRLPNKHFLIFKKKPLIFHTFNSINNLGINKQSYLSTNDEKIINFSKKFKINTLFKRPNRLSRPKTETIDVILHFLKKLEKQNIKYEYLVLLQCTSPLRKDLTIKKACEYVIKNKLDSLVTVSELPFNYKYLIQSHKNIFLKKTLDMSLKNNTPIYFLNGAIFIAKIEKIKKHKSILFKTNNIYKMPFKESIDIDNSNDLNLAKLF